MPPSLSFTPKKKFPEKTGGTVLNKELVWVDAQKNRSKPCKSGTAGIFSNREACQWGSSRSCSTSSLNFFESAKLGSVRMFRATLLPSASVYGSWSTMLDVCAWAAVDDEMWLQFAGKLGDTSLQNISLVAALHPADVKEAIEAATPGVVARTKLRLVCAAARLKFGLDPVDVGAPPPPGVVEPPSAGLRGGGGGAPTLKVKVVSVLEQALDREVERLPLEDLRKLWARFRAVEGR